MKDDIRNHASPRTIAASLLTANVGQPATKNVSGVKQSSDALLIRSIHSLRVMGCERIEADTILSYVSLRIGQEFSQARADHALEELLETELFADIQIANAAGNVTIQVKENPIINRIIFEGNRRIKEEKITREMKIAPRQIFTRSRVRADVARLMELYKRSGHPAASIEPKMVILDNNRIDLIFEIEEGRKSSIRQVVKEDTQKIYQAKSLGYFSENSTVEQVVDHDGANNSSLYNFSRVQDFILWASIRQQEDRILASIVRRYGNKKIRKRAQKIVQGEGKIDIAEYVQREFCGHLFVPMAATASSALSVLVASTNLSMRFARSVRSI